MEESVFNSVECTSNQSLDTITLEKQEDVIPVSFHIETKWDGIVLEIDGDQIFSRMTDTLSNDEYEFDFKLEDIEEDDRPLVQEGALFNFYLGYTTKGKTRVTSKVIKFRRQPTSRSRIDAILDKMNNLNISNLIELH